MTYKFENSFHKRYVGGDGVIEESSLVAERPPKIQRQTLEEIRDHYRKYIGDSAAELPAEMLVELKKLGKILA